MSTNEIVIDTNRQTTLFKFITTEGSTPSLRAYVFNNGTASSLEAGNTAKFVYATARTATEMVEVDSLTISAGDEYIDFEFTSEKLNINGIFFASIIVYDTGSDSIIVQSDGTIELLRNPALDGGATILDVSTTINWNLYTNIGNFPWSIGNDVITPECSDSPYPVLRSDASKEFIHNNDCDIIFELVEGNADDIGTIYSFNNLKTAYTVTLQCQEGDSIDNSPTTGIKYTIRNHPIAASCFIRLVTANHYETIFGDGCWAVAAGEVSLSSSSSEEYSSSSSSSSSSS